MFVLAYCVTSEKGSDHTKLTQFFGNFLNIFLVLVLGWPELV